MSALISGRGFIITIHKSQLCNYANEVCGREALCGHISPQYDLIINVLIILIIKESSFHCGTFLLQDCTVYETENKILHVVSVHFILLYDDIISCRSYGSTPANGNMFDIEDR